MSQTCLCLQQNNKVIEYQAMENLGNKGIRDHLFDFNMLAYDFDFF